MRMVTIRKGNKSLHPILAQLARLRVEYCSTEDEGRKRELERRYETLVDGLPKDVQSFHRGLVGGDVV
jgi:hypothetical protein